MNTPYGMVQLQQASRLNSREAFKAYTKHLDEVNKSVTLRGVLKLKTMDKTKSIPISEVEEAKEIVKRFNTGDIPSCLFVSHTFSHSLTPTHTHSHFLTPPYTHSHPPSHTF